MIRKLIDWKWHGGLLLVIALTCFNVFNKLASAERSGYYSIVAKSMSLSWSNFFFGSLDPSGIISIDKIPGSYWLPALLVRFFGFHNKTVVAPNGIAVVLAIVVMAYAARRVGGALVGLLTALLVASTPIVVAVARSNQPEGFFILSIAISTFLIVTALKLESRRHLILAGLAIGLAFQSYMIVAWALWPALAAAWMLTAKPIFSRLKDLAIAGTVSAISSLLWIFIVWLIPATNRPYIGNTLHNNPWEMVFGYNALGRFAGASHMSGISKGTLASFKTFTPPFAGHPGLLRFFYHQNIGQISWLLISALIAFVYLWKMNKHRKLNTFLGLWLVTDFVMFSSVAGMHQFYTATMSFPMAIIVAMALRDSWQNRHEVWFGAIVASAFGMALIVAHENPSYLALLPLAQTALGLIAMVIWRLHASGRFWKVSSAIAAISGLCLTPLVWTMDAQRHPSFTNPIAGPSETYRSHQLHTGVGISHGQVIHFLKTHSKGSKYLLAAFGVDAAAPYILQSDRPVLALGGFSGADPAPTLEGFENLVHAGAVKYVLLNHFQGDALGFNFWEASKIKKWVKLNCNRDYRAPSNIPLWICSNSTRRNY